MPDGDEIARFKIDTSDADAKLRALEAQFAKLRGQMEGGAGGADAVAKDAGATERAADATDRLRGGKEKLAAVLNLTGSHLGETSSRLAQLIELLLFGNGAVLAFTGALAGVGAGIALWRELSSVISDSVERLKQFEEMQEKARQKAMQRSGEIVKMLAERGAASPENVLETGRLASALEKHGFFAEDARSAAALAVTDGITDQGQIVALAYALQQKQTFTHRGQARAYVEGLSASGGLPPILAAADKQRQALVGQSRDSEIVLDYLKREGKAEQFNVKTPGDVERALEAARGAQAILPLAEMMKNSGFLEKVFSDLADVWAESGQGPLGARLGAARGLELQQTARRALQESGRGPLLGEAGPTTPPVQTNIGQQVVLDPFGRRVRREAMTDRAP